MQFLYHKYGGDTIIELNGEDLNYIIKVKRKKVGDKLYVRDESTQNLYIYNIENIKRSKAILTLDSSSVKSNISKNELILGWCKIDIKVLEKTLPFLNELGVKYLFLIDCEYSQKNFIPDIQRLERILKSSNMQCGRSDLMKIDEFNSLEEFYKNYPESILIHFSNQTLDTKIDKCVVVGPEGGFSQKELKLYENRHKGLNKAFILRSQTAITSVASLY